MPYSQEEKNYIFQQEGIDPNTHDINDAGFVVAKPPAPVAPTNAPTPGSTPKPSVIATAAKSAASELLPAVGGGLSVAGGLGVLEAAGLLSGVGTIPTALIGAGLGLAGAYGTRKAQDAVMPDNIREAITPTQSEVDTNPIASRLGALAPNLLFGNPVKGAGNLLGALKALPSALSANGLRDIDKEILKQAAIGSGINTGITVAQGGTSPADIATAVAGGALFNTPWNNNPLNKVFGLTPLPEDYRATGIVPKTTGFDGERSPYATPYATPVATPYASAVATPYAAPVPNNIKALLNDKVLRQQIEETFQKTLNRSATEKDILDAYQSLINTPEKVDPLAGLGAKNSADLEAAGAKAIEQNSMEIAQQQAIAKAVEMERLKKQAQAGVDTTPAESPIPTIPKSDFDAAIAARQAESAKRNAKEIPAPSMPTTEGERQLVHEAELSKEAGRLMEIKANNDKIALDKVREIIRSKIKAAEDNPAYVEQKVREHLDKLSARFPELLDNPSLAEKLPIRYSSKEGDGHTLTPAEEALANRRGFAIAEDTQLPAAGAEQYSTRQTKINPERANATTSGHETIGHGMLEDLKNSLDPRDRALADKIEGSNDAETNADLIGAEVERRRKLKETGGMWEKLKNYYEDYKNYRKGDKGDAIRQLGNRAINDASFGTRKELVNEKTVGKTFKEMQDLPDNAFQGTGTHAPTVGTSEEDNRVRFSKKHWDTPEFKKWFGESEIRNEDGTPKVVYHGTKSLKNFSEFNPTGVEPLSHFGDTHQANEFSGPDIFYSYIGVEHGVHTPKTYPVYLSIENPLKVKDYFNKSPKAMLKYLSDERIISPYDLEHINEVGTSTNTTYGHEWNDRAKWLALVKVLGKKGYDGFEYQNTSEGRVGHPDNTAYVPFHNTQIKSASGNTGEYNSYNPDIRYSKPSATASLREAPKFSEIDRIAADKDTKDVAPHLNEMHNTHRRLQGEFVHDPIHNLKKAAGLNLFTNPKAYIRGTTPELDRVSEYMRDMHVDGSSKIKLTAKEKELKGIAENMLLNIKKKIMEYPDLNDNMPRENYFPETFNSRVIDTLRANAQSPEARRLKDLYIKNYVDRASVSSKNPDPTKIRAAAEDAWNTTLSAFQHDKKVNIAKHFGPTDLHASFGLPKELSEMNLVSLLQQFGDRSARRLAYHTAIEKTPAQDMLFDPKGQNLSANPKVAHVLDSFTGLKDRGRSISEGVNGVIASAFTGTFSGVRDVASTQFHGVQHMGIGQIPRAILHGLTNFKKSWSESIKLGIRPEHTSSILGADDLAGYNGALAGLRKLREVMNVASGRQALENIGRTMAYGQGKFLAVDNVGKYREGKLLKGSQEEKFLNDFGPKDWRTLFKKAPSEKDLQLLAANYTDSVTQTYNPQDLPKFATDSPVAPFLQLSRWSIGKANNFIKYSVDPALNGNFKPLLNATLFTLLGGGATIEALNELITNRRSKLPTLKELEATSKMDGNTKKMIAYKIAGLASLSAYGGEMSNLVKMAFDKHLGNRSTGYEYLAQQQFETLTTYVPAIVKALSEGDIEKFTVVASDALEATFQNYRVAMAHLSDTKKAQIEHSNKFTDERIFEQSTKDSAAVSPDIKPNYDNYRASQFRKLNLDTLPTSDGVAASSRAAIGEVLSGEGDYYEKKHKLSGLKHGSQQFFPDPATNPVQAQKYKMFMDMSGKDGSSRLKDFLMNKEFQKAKSSIIPSI